MGKREFLGTFEQLVLYAVLRLGPDEAYGVAVQKAISSSTDREISIGAVTTTLARLEREGLLKSRWGEKTPERGGRRKRYYEIQAAGVHALNNTRNAIDGMRIRQIPVLQGT